MDYFNSMYYFMCYLSCKQRNGGNENMLYEEFLIKVKKEIIEHMSDTFNENYEPKITNNIEDGNKDCLYLISNDEKTKDVIAPKIDMATVYEKGYLGKYNENFEATIKELALVYEQAYRIAPRKKSKSEEVIEEQPLACTIIPMKYGQYLISGPDVYNDILNPEGYVKTLAVKNNQDVFILPIDKNNYIAEPMNNITDEEYDFYEKGLKAFAKKHCNNITDKPMLYCLKTEELLKNKDEILNRCLTGKSKAL